MDIYLPKSYEHKDPWLQLQTTSNTIKQGLGKPIAKGVDNFAPSSGQRPFRQRIKPQLAFVHFNKAQKLLAT